MLCKEKDIVEQKCTVRNEEFHLVYLKNRI